MRYDHLKPIPDQPVNYEDLNPKYTRRMQAAQQAKWNRRSPAEKERLARQLAQAGHANKGGKHRKGQ